MAFWAVLFDESCKKVLYMWVINSGVRAVTYQWRLRQDRWIGVYGVCRGWVRGGTVDELAVAGVLVTLRNQR